MTGMFLSRCLSSCLVFRHQNAQCMENDMCEFSNYSQLTKIFVDVDDLTPREWISNGR